MTLGRLLVHGMHACAFPESPSESSHLVADFVADGLAEGDRVCWFTETVAPSECIRQLDARGVPAIESATAGQLSVRSAVAAYLPSGWFDPDEMVEGLLADIDDARAAGFAGIRFIGEMGWAKPHIPGTDELLDYELRVTDVFDGQPAMGLCLYGTHAFDREMLSRAEQVHPVVLRWKDPYRPD